MIWENISNELARNSSGNARPQSSRLTEPLWTDPGVKSGISALKLISNKNNTQKKIKAQAGNEWLNIFQKSSHARKKPPPPPPPPPKSNVSLTFSEKNVSHSLQKKMFFTESSTSIGCNTVQNNTTLQRSRINTIRLSNVAVSVTLAGAFLRNRIVLSADSKGGDYARQSWPKMMETATKSPLLTSFWNSSESSVG